MNVEANKHHTLWTWPAPPIARVSVRGPPRRPAPAHLCAGCGPIRPPRIGEPTLDGVLTGRRYAAERQDREGRLREPERCLQDRRLSTTHPGFLPSGCRVEDERHVPGDRRVPRL